MSLIIAVPRERRTSERRVALDPSRVERLLQSGFQVRIEAECGHAASFQDEDYHGVPVSESFAEVVNGADIVVKVVCPTLEEIALLPRGSVLICVMSAFQHVEELRALCERKITVLAMDHLPRTTRAQPMDALSSQATVAGYKAALLAAELSPRLFPMLTTAAGTIRPSRVLVIGAGVAGLQAIATAKRLGAQVEAYDIRRAAKEQIESVGAKMIDTGVEVEGAGGFARALRKDEKQKQHDVLAEHLARAHVVICAAAIPGRRAPRIITEDMVDGMLPESVIVDMAASTGGNCELTRSGEHYYHNDTLIVGPLNLPSHGAVHASEMYARNVHNMLELITRDGEVVMDASDDIIARCVLMHNGQVHHANSAKLLDTEAVTLSGALHSTREMPDQTSGWLNDETADGDESSGGSQDNEPADAQASDVPEKAHGSAPQPEQASPASQATDAVNPDEETAVPVAELTQPPVDPEADAQGVVSEESGADEAYAALDDQPDAQALADLAALDGVEPAEAEPGGDRHEAEEAVGDDLTRIEGIGPALQSRLYAFGYRELTQLAELSDTAAEQLAVQLELGDEINEQDWAGQARRLMENQS